MIICKNDADTKAVFDDIAKDGFEWHTPLPLFAGEYWDDGETPQVEDYCPGCRFLTDRDFNMTNTQDGWHWSVSHCLECGAVWFDKDLT